MGAESTYRRSGLGVSRAAPAALAALLAFLMLAGGALALSPPPAPLANPNTSSQGAADTQGYASASLRAEEEVLASDVNTSFTTLNSPYFQLTDYSVKLTNWLSPSHGEHLVRAQTWVNLTAGCTGVGSCPGYYACDGSTSPTFSNVPQSYLFTSRGCFDIWVNWTHLNNLPNKPQWSIQRLVTVAVTSNQTWGLQGRSDFGYANLTSYGYADFGASFAPSYFATLKVSWWVPYPAGNWYQPFTTFASVDYGTVYPQSEYAIGSSAFFVQWGAGFPAASGDATYHYLFTLVSLTSNTTPPPPPPNGTGGGTPPTTPPPVGEVVLTLGNVSALSPGRETSYATWLNGYPYNVSATFFLEASWLASAANVTLFINGVPLPAFDYSVSSTAIVVFSGVVTVGSEQEVSFSADFQPVSSFCTSFASVGLCVIGYLGPYAISVMDIVAAGGLLGAALVVWWEARAYVGGRRAQRAADTSSGGIVGGLVSVGLFTLFVFAVVTLG